MWTIRVLERGRALAHHDVETLEEARELAAVYMVLGYAPEKIEILQGGAERQAA
jgi:hypothetical protein